MKTPSSNIHSIGPLYADDLHDWLDKSASISKQINLNLVVSSFLLNCTIAIDQKKGYDLADLKQINLDCTKLVQSNHEPISLDLELLLQRNPYLFELIRVFDLFLLIN